MEVKEIKKEITITFDDEELKALKYICEIYKTNAINEVKENYDVRELADDIFNLEI